MLTGCNVLRMIPLVFVLASPAVSAYADSADAVATRGSGAIARDFGRETRNKVLKGSELVDVRVSVDDGKVLSTRPMEHGHMAKAKATHEKTEPAGTKS